MTAIVTRLAPRGVNVDIGSHLVGTTRRQTGMIDRMMGQEAIRLFVRAIASKHPLGDQPGKHDVWTQVEDVCAAVPNLASSTVELENYVHAIRRTISPSKRHGLASGEGDMQVGHVRISACGRRLRLAIDDAGGRRIMDFRLEEDGAIRIGDHMAGE